MTQRRRLIIQIGCLLGWPILANVTLFDKDLDRTGRLMANTPVTTQKVSSSTPATPAQQTDTTQPKAEIQPAVSPPTFLFPPLPPQVDVGDRISLIVQVEHPEIYEYRWLTKYGQKSWDWSAPWVKNAEYFFAPTLPGKYAIQVNIRHAHNETPITQKWLGSTDVIGPLVQRLSYLPAATALPADIPVTFVAEPRPEFPLDELEFRLWSLKPTNKIVNDWQPWPLPPYKALTPKTTGLQIDVRMKKFPSIMHRTWLNSFYFSTRQNPPNVNLIRSLIADDFQVCTMTEETETLARELWLVTHLMVWEHLVLSPKQQALLLRIMPLVKNITPIQGDKVALELIGGGCYEVDLGRRSIRQEKSPVTLDISLTTCEDYRAIFRAMAGQSKLAMAIAAVTHAVYTGYHYGTPPFRYLQHVADVVSHCGTQSNLLKQILKLNHVECEVICLHVPDEQGGFGVHALVQVNHPTQVPLLLDPSNGYLYEFDAQWLGTKDIPDPIILPQCRQLNFLDLRLLYRPGTRVISKRLANMAVPQQPVAQAMTQSSP